MKLALVQSPILCKKSFKHNMLIPNSCISLDCIMCKTYWPHFCPQTRKGLFPELPWYPELKSRLMCQSPELPFCHSAGNTILAVVSERGQMQSFQRLTATQDCKHKVSEKKTHARYFFYQGLIFFSCLPTDSVSLLERCGMKTDSFVTSKTQVWR